MTSNRGKSDQFWRLQHHFSAARFPLHALISWKHPDLHHHELLMNIKNLGRSLHHLLKKTFIRSPDSNQVLGPPESSLIAVPMTPLRTCASDGI